MPKPRDLEEELWTEYDGLKTLGGEVEFVDRRLKALELILKTRSAGEKADPRKPEGASGDDAVASARKRANTPRQ